MFGISTYPHIKSFCQSSLLYNIIMNTGKNIIIISIVIILIVLGVVYYFFIKKNLTKDKPTYKEKTSEEIIKELQAYKPSTEVTKTPEQINKELSSYKGAPGILAPTDKQVLEDLKNFKP